MSALDDFAPTIGSTFSSADIMRMLSFGFDIVASEAATRHVIKRSLGLADNTRTLILIDKERGLVMI